LDPVSIKRSPPLSRSTLAAFAAPAAPTASLGLPLLVYLPPFYANEMGLGLGVVGTVFMLTRFWDVFTDPVLGVLSEELPTRWGRRRHWLVASVPILLVSVYHVFLPVPPVSAAYLLGWMMLLYVGWTLLTISHLSWGAELTGAYHERSRVQGWREIFLIAGMIAVLVLPAVIESAGGVDRGVVRVAAMGWFIVLLLPLTVGWAVVKVPEPEVPVSLSVPWSRTLRILAANRVLRRILLMDLIGGLGGGVVGALFIFLVTDRFLLGDSASVLLLVYFVTGCLAVPFMIRISFRFGKHRTLAVSSLFNAAALPMIFALPPGNLALAAAGFVIFGVNMGVGPFLFRSMMADVADHDHAESGIQRTGVYFALLTMTNKVGHALSIGVIYPILAWLGYRPGFENTTEAVAHLTAIYVLVPAACSAAVAALLWRYPLDERRQEELRRRIEERNLSGEASARKVAGRST
jgi:GPH family glycoside/pentoside/hexuronide:cation symporter